MTHTFKFFFWLKVEFLAVKRFLSLNSYCEWEYPGEKKKNKFFFKTEKETT